MNIPRNTLMADSGFLIALFDVRQPHHSNAKAWLQQHPEPLLTVEAVVVEVSYFLAGTQRHACLDAVAARALVLMTAGDDSPQRIAELSKKYDNPDYANLTLIDLAERTGLTAILTDVHDFSLYRIKGRRCFELVIWH